jgi:membrane protease YdiL (CAAX protease family)
MKQSDYIKIFACFLALVFYLGEIIFRGQIEAVSMYGIYFFEALWVLAVYFVFRKISWLNREKIIPSLVLIFVTAVLGASVHVLATINDILIPFDLDNAETILFLILLGPVLEEFVFRYGFWSIFESLIKSRWILILITAVLFSFSHFQLISEFPPEIHGFIHYQSAYTFVLGVFCGYLRAYSGLSIAITAHILFNLGFYLAR